MRSDYVVPKLAEQRPCSAARAVECVAETDPALAYEVTRALYRSRRENSAIIYNEDTLRAIIDPITSFESIRACVVDPPQTVVKRIRRHVRYAEDVARFLGTPGIIIVGLDDDGRFSPRMRNFVGEKQPATIEAWINNVKQRPR